MTPEAAPYLLLLEPVIVPKPWGGRRLERLGKTLPTAGTYGESWDVADLPEGTVTGPTANRTAISNGALAGRTLSDVTALWGNRFLGSAAATTEGDFPLLFKLLDAREHLSVQVHPDETYVAGHPEARLKTESWYIVDAMEGSVIYKGLRPGVSIEDISAAAGTPALVELLEPVPAEIGAFHHLPAGLVHALGAGVMVAEPQTPSDTTFRLYDWVEEYERAPRALHVAESIEATRIQPHGRVTLPPSEPSTVRTLVSTRHYWIREHASVTSAGYLATAPELRVLSVLSGRVTFRHGDQVVELLAGGTLIVPAVVATEVHVVAVRSTMLEIGLVGDPPVSASRPPADGRDG